MTGGAAQGHVNADVSGFAVGGLVDASLHVDAAFQGHRVSGSLRGEVPGVGRGTLKVAKLEVGPRGALDPEGWRKAFGGVELAAALDLSRVTALLPMAEQPVANVSGTLAVQGRFSRDSSDDAIPELKISAHTEHLALDLKGLALRSTGIDAQLDATIDGQTGYCELAARFVDDVGPLVAVDAKSSDVPYAELLASPLDAARRMQSVPFALTAVVPRRGLRQLPPMLASFVPRATGDVEATMHVGGTVLAPRVDLSAKADKLVFSGSPFGVPLGGTLGARYDGAQADVSVAVHTDRGVEVLRGGAHADAKMSDVLALAPGHSPPWRGSANAELTRFPLGAVATLADGQVHGFASGTFALSDLHVDPRATLEVRLDDLRVGSATLGTGRLTATIDGKALSAQARLDQPDGFIDTNGTVGISWGTALAPTVLKDPARVGEAHREPLQSCCPAAVRAEHLQRARWAHGRRRARRQ